MKNLCARTTPFCSWDPPEQVNTRSRCWFLRLIEPIRCPRVFGGRGTGPSLTFFSSIILVNVALKLNNLQYFSNFSILRKHGEIVCFDWMTIEQLTNYTHRVEWGEQFQIIKNIWSLHVSCYLRTALVLIFYRIFDKLVEINKSVKIRWFGEVVNKRIRMNQVCFPNQTSVNPNLLFSICYAHAWSLEFNCVVWKYYFWRAKIL